MLAADGSEEREQWCLDNWDAVAASVAAAQNVSLGVAVPSTVDRPRLRHRLPRVAEVFAAGAISYRHGGRGRVARTRLIKDSDALRQGRHRDRRPHHAIGGRCRWIRPSAEIDYWVDRYDPAAVRRTEDRARGRHVDVHEPQDGSGPPTSRPGCSATDAEALDQRLDAMARCGVRRRSAHPGSAPRRRPGRLWARRRPAGRAAASDPDCDAAGKQPSAVVVHVIAHEESLTDDTPAQLDGEEPPDPPPAQLGEMTITEALTDRTATTARPAATPPAALMGGGMLPAPLLAAKIAGHREDRADRAPRRRRDRNAATFPRRCWRRSSGAGI